MEVYRIQGGLQNTERSIAHTEVHRIHWSTEYREVYRIHGGLQNTGRSTECREVYRIQ